MRILRTKKWAVLAAFVVGGAIGVSAAIAATTNILVADTNTVRERIVQISTDGGFNSGWHIHPGPVIVQVQHGYLKITQNTCNPTVVGPGDTYIETPGQPVLATANKATSWTITEIFPDSHPGDPDRVATTNPC
jgi:quercetin dioxygenase-like cupin family protein